MRPKQEWNLVTIIEILSIQILKIIYKGKKTLKSTYWSSDFIIVQDSFVYWKEIGQKIKIFSINTDAFFAVQYYYNYYNRLFKSYLKFHILDIK